MRRSILAALAAFALLGQGVLLGQEQKGDEGQLPERFRAFAANLGSVQTSADNRMVEMQVSRWTTKAQEQELLEALKQKGPKGLLDVMQDMPATGWIRSQGGLSYDLRYAREQKTENGRVITLMTDRPLNYWEMAGSSISRDYPFTVIQLKLNDKGSGEGSVSMATKITMEAGLLVFEDLSSRPIQLLSVTKEK